MAFDSVPAHHSQQPESISESSEEVRGRHRAGPCCCQLNRQRDPVQLATQCLDYCAIVAGVCGVDRTDSVLEQFDAFKDRVERRYYPHALPIDGQRLAMGHQNR